MSARSSDCVFCSKISQALERRKRWIEENLRPEDITSDISIGIGLFEYDKGDYGLLSRIYFHMPSTPISILDAAIWADEGVPASSKLVTQPPIFRNNVDEIGPVVQRWLRDCLGHHLECEAHMIAPLPTRVLSVVDKNGDHCVRLVETGSAEGAYCALSHCWGPANMQPLRTTKENLQNHFAMIPIQQLPRTFYDAVLLTRQLGIRYLWIDSLCIIQDDEDDWLRESANMGPLYRNAALVIAAAGAQDSTQGLFIGKRNKPRKYRFPYVVDGQLQGSYNLAMTHPLPRDSLSDTPLRQRAWAFQEWYLAQRIVFAAEEIEWHCNSKTLNERGNRADLGLYEKSSWGSLLSEYSTKVLTYPSDRLVAIGGIVAEQQRITNKKFKFGAWDDGSCQQLLWKVLQEQRPEDSLPELPSWSWAATDGAKAWVTEDLTVFEVAKSIGITDDGILKVTAPISRVHIAQSPVPECCAEYISVSAKIPGESILKSFELAMLEPWSQWGFDHWESFVVFNENGTDDVLGLAAFDGPRQPPVVFAAIVTRTNRDKCDPCNPRFINPRPVFRPAVVSGSEHTTSNIAGNNAKLSQALPPNHHDDTDNCQNFRIIGKSECVYWGLLLEPIHKKKLRFMRAGICLLYPRAWEIAQGNVQELEIY